MRMFNRWLSTVNSLANIEDTNKRLGIISNHWVEFFKNKDAQKAKHSEKMEDIVALYINVNEDQLVLKTRQIPNIIISTKYARDVLRVLYAIKMWEGWDVYQLDEDMFDEYLDDDSIPDSSYLVNNHENERTKDFNDLDISSDEYTAEDEVLESPILTMGQKVK